MTSQPIWITPAGLLGTAYELTSAYFNVQALGSGVVYSLHNGILPPGLTLDSSGNISGIPEAVLQDKPYVFVIRATSEDFISADRSFTILVVGADAPEFVTTQTFLNVGVFNEPYAINNQYVDFQIQAEKIQSPASATLTYFIPDRGGILPPGLSLSRSGKISGYLRDKIVPNTGIDLDGGYDVNPYEAYYYDYTGLQLGDDLTSIGLPKYYPFLVTVTDGILTTTGTFTILVTTMDILKYNPESMPPEINSSTFSNTNYIQPLQWLIPSDLGTLRSNNNQDLEVFAYDPDPLIGPVKYYVNTGTGIFNNPPVYLKLEQDKGHLYGYVPYQPSYTENYTFEIQAEKTDSRTGYKFTTTNTYSLAVKGAVDSSIIWITTSSDLGTLEVGVISEKYVEAKLINSEYNIKYNLESGTLPEGLELVRDGSLSGRAATGSTGTYTFTVVASDVYETGSISKEFYLIVNQPTAKTYTEIYFRPFLSSDKRNLYQEFTNDEFIFDPKLIYRYFDSNFGVQHDIKMVLEFGLEEINLEDYVPALAKNYYRKTLTFGDVKVARATNSTGTTVYEVVYVDIVDNQMNSQNQSVGLEINHLNKTYYPASIANMRTRLEQIILPDNSVISVNERNLPRFMRNSQDTNYLGTGYIQIVPLCYALPGEGKRVQSRIRLKKWDFSVIHFEIDRLIVNSSLDNPAPRYLLFPRVSITS